MIEPSSAIGILSASMHALDFVKGIGDTLKVIGKTEALTSLIAFR